MTIIIDEQIGIGNMVGDTDEMQKTVALNYARLLETELRDYCAKNYPDAELIIGLPVENVSGCTRSFSVDVDGLDFDTDYDAAYEQEKSIIEDIEWHQQVFAEKLLESAELYK